MKRGKRALILAGVLAVLVLVYVGVQKGVSSQPEAVTEESGAYPLTSHTAEELTSLQWSFGDGEEQETLHFVKADGQWRVEGNEAFPVKQDSVEGLAETLTALKADRRFPKGNEGKRVFFQQLLKIFMHLIAHHAPVVQPGPLEVFVLQRKAQRLDEMQHRAGRGAGAGNIAGILGNFRLVKHDMHGNHLPGIVPEMRKVFNSRRPVRRIRLHKLRPVFAPSPTPPQRRGRC